MSAAERKSGRSSPAVLGLALAAGLAACGPGAAVPDPDTADMQPAVRAILAETRDSVLADPDSAAAWGRYGGALFAHELFAEAEACYREAAALAPDDFAWSYHLAGVLERSSGDADEIVARYALSEKLRPEYPPTPFRLGEALARLGRHEEARAAFERAIALDPGLAIAHRGLGQTLLALGDAEAALEQLRRADELAPDDAQVLSGLARAYGRLGEAEAARRSGERARSARATIALPDPLRFEVENLARSSEKCLARGKARLERGELDGAIEDLFVVLETRPDDAAVHALLGRAYARKQDSELAVRHMQRALELAPGDGPLQAELAFELARADRLEEALAAFQRADVATSLDPAQLQTWGNVFLKLGRLEEAVPRYERVLARQPENEDALWALGLAEERLGRTDAAIRRFRALVALDPGHAAAERLARLESGRR